VGIREIRIPFFPRKWQQYCINKLTRFNLWVIHRRGGKTFLAIGTIVDEVASEPLHNPQGAYVGITYASAKKVAWPYLKDLLKDWPGVRFYENELKAVMPRDKDVATIYLLGSEDPDTLRGIYLDILVLDERAFMRSSIDKVILPTITDRKGKVIQISSVNGRNSFYKDYLRYRKMAEDGNDNFFAISLTAEDTLVIPKDELELVKLNMTEEEYRQEYLNDFSAGDAATFYGSQVEKMYDEGRITRVPYDPMYPLDVFFDLGMNDMTSMWFRQTVGREFRYIDYYQNSGEAIPHYIQEMRSRYPKAQWGRIVLPHDASVRELGTGKTRQETFHAMGVRTEIQDKQALTDRINAVRTHLPKCVIDADKCAEGLECLQNYRKKKDDRNDVFMNTPVHDKYSHGADAFGYAALDERPSLEDMRKRIESFPDKAQDDYDIYGGW
jgi:phage terminase large subunit